MTDNLPAPQEQSWDDMLPVAASNKAIQRYNAVIDFAVNTLKFGNHYDVLPAEQWKCKNKNTDMILKDPSIKKFFTQSGADMTNMAWGIRSEAVVMNAVERPDDKEPYFSYQIQSNLIHIGTGKVVGSAVGSCSSREVKFRYRWFTKEEIEHDPRLVDVDMAQCKTKMFGWDDKGKLKYQVVNPDLGDVQPTIFMMAEKRAYVKATRRLFGLSELFNQPLDAIESSILEEIEPDTERKKEPERAKLPDNDIKPGDPAKHQDVRKPHGAFEPPPPDDGDFAGKPGKPTKQGDTIRELVGKFIMAKELDEKGADWVWGLLEKKWGPPEMIRAPAKIIQAWLNGEATKELQDENFLPRDR